ncbi:MAG TPA: type II toxin-antitoxin system RelE/ParE family toxin [Rhizomicrobium sp.]|nr:type II toxin-antitoxin system RelE/ParE family toxin [Rhizomicrobium sp.]
MNTNWPVFFVNAAARAELDALPADMRAKFERIVALIQSHGLEKVREPYVKHLDGKLWEMRLIGRDGIARAIYVTASGKRVFVLRTFVKKTEKTPKRELELARERAKEVV